MNGNNQLVDWNKILEPYSGKTVAITGASGFVGTRLVQVLLKNRKIKVIPLINRFHNAVRLSRFPLDFRKVNLLNVEELNSVFNSVDVVIHLAYSGAGTEAQQRTITVDGSKNVFQACLNNKVAKVVHVSTMAVYGIKTSGLLHENIPNKKSDFIYADAKIEAEELAIEMYKNNQLPVTIIQPAIIYGPFSGSWSQSILQNLKNKDFYLPDNGDGICNPVYVDDVVQSLLLAGINNKVNGERFLISGNEQITWKEYYGYYEEMLNIKAIKLIDYNSLKKLSKKLSGKKNLFDMIKYVFGRRRTINIAKQIGVFKLLFRFIMMFMSEEKWNQIKNDYFPDPDENEKTDEREIAMYPLFFYDILRAKPKILIEKAKNLLGYQPKYNLNDGIKLTRKWAEWANLL